MIVWLDAPAEILAERDGEHGPAQLAASRDRFAHWAGVLGNVVRVDSGAGPPETVARTIRGRLDGAVPPAGAGS
jgi:hypothetical protein